MATVTGITLTVNAFHLADAADQLRALENDIRGGSFDTPHFLLPGVGVTDYEQAFGDPATGSAFEQSVTAIDQAVTQMAAAVGHFAEALTAAGHEYTKVDVTALRS